MNRQLSLTFAVLLLFITASAKNDYNTWWQKGNGHYKQKNYDSAAYYYNNIASQQPRNAEVYYNLGNAYYRLNDIGKAILNYERALKIKPSHKQAADNLYLTQSRINNRIQEMPKIFFVKWWNAMTSAGMANVFAFSAAILFLLLMGLHIAKRLNRIRFNIRVQVSFAVLVVCAALITLGIISAQRLVHNNYAVVMQEGAVLMPEPKYGKSQSLIPEGTKVEICDRKGDWLEITLPDGRTGWMQQTSLTGI